MVGLTGYPNVGKSSTINALFGAKKTAVAPTPGKTKHFQTLNVSEHMTLCDCPGLVIPKYAASKAEMVAAGEGCPLHAVIVHVVYVYSIGAFLVEAADGPDGSPCCLPSHRVPGRAPAKRRQLFNKNVPVACLSAAYRLLHLFNQEG